MPEFLPLHIALRPRALSAPVSAPSPPREEPTSSFESEPEATAVAGEIRRFRAAVADAFEHEVESLLRDVACTVLARELELKPADIEVVVTQARRRHARERIIALRVHPADLEALKHFDLDVLADGTLHRGDVVLELKSGTIDLSLGVRLDAVLASERA
ncbi:MAG: hypothetical protein JO092_01185 [Candidatus Eremiobacteraeota bacterium]|nr:hypothetical protein [Candidatus Eremiobacteraeota bacterium]